MAATDTMHGDPVSPAGTDGMTSAEHAQESAEAKSNRFVMELLRAMKAAAEQNRAATMDQFGTDSKAFVEALKNRAGVEANELRRIADEDLAAVREWSKAEIARIKAETDERGAERRGDLERQLDEHATLFERQLEKVRAGISGFETEMERFFAALTAEQDPGVFATTAQQMPQPPVLDELDAQARADALSELARGDGAGSPASLALESGQDHADDRPTETTAASNEEQFVAAEAQAQSFSAAALATESSDVSEAEASAHAFATEPQAIATHPSAGSDAAGGTPVQPQEDLWSAPRQDAGQYARQQDAATQDVATQDVATQDVATQNLWAAPQTAPSDAWTPPAASDAWTAPQLAPDAGAAPQDAWAPPQGWPGSSDVPAQDASTQDPWSVGQAAQAQPADQGSSSHLDQTSAAAAPSDLTGGWAPPASAASAHGDNGEPAGMGASWSSWTPPSSDQPMSDGSLGGIAPRQDSPDQWNPQRIEPPAADVAPDLASQLATPEWQPETAALDPRLVSLGLTAENGHYPQPATDQRPESAEMPDPWAQPTGEHTMPEAEQADPESTPLHDPAARLAGLVPSSEPANGRSSQTAALPEVMPTQVVVTGLVSVASIASFKRHLARVPGVQSVGVSSGPDGEFIFKATHDPEVALREVIPALPGFGARVVSAADGALHVTARDPEADA